MEITVARKNNRETKVYSLDIRACDVMRESDLIEIASLLRVEAERLEAKAGCPPPSYVYVSGRSSGKSLICVECGGEMKAQTDMAYTSSPPQYKCICSACGHTTYRRRDEL